RSTKMIVARTASPTAVLVVLEFVYAAAVNHVSTQYRHGAGMASRVRLPSISLIVARSYPGNVIGYQNKLPWHIKSDLKRFKSITSGHVIIMGRSTFDSIGRVLPERTNIVMSATPRPSIGPSFQADETTQLFWTNRREDALFLADVISIWRKVDDIFVIGGEKMYTLFDDLVNR